MLTRRTLHDNVEALIPYPIRKHCGEEHRWPQPLNALDAIFELQTIESRFANINIDLPGHVSPSSHQQSRFTFQSFRSSASTFLNVFCFLFHISFLRILTGSASEILTIERRLVSSSKINQLRASVRAMATEVGDGSVASDDKMERRLRIGMRRSGKSVCH
jgi:hypothetical protein